MSPRKRKGEFTVDIFMKFEDMSLAQAADLHEFIKDGFSRDSSATFKPVVLNMEVHGAFGEATKNE